MTDREMLELAAKAAGIHIDKSKHNGGGDGNTGFDVLGNAVLDWHNGKTWNPLTDDGDALRLAVRMQLQLDLRHMTNEVSAYGSPSGRIDEGVRIDPLAATRRAITRAAASMAKESAT